ncbi:glycosyltransferase family 2 protein [Puniceicoccaceae bacterium]|nr:glycosyltransferase family 2 protein [Puniceicoccaceae bacterium]
MFNVVPEISVLISTYDDRALVEKKLREIQQQTAFLRAEFIFIEPASPGLEREVLQPFCEQHANCRLIAQEERVGLYQAWNIGWEAASAPLVCISNMDDTMHPLLLERVLLGMSQNRWDVATVLIAKQGIDDALDSWDCARLRRLPLSTRPGAFFVWRNDLKSTLGMFNEALTIVGDKEFWARIGHLKLKIGLIPELLYLYTKHPTQLSKRPEFRARKKAEEAQCKQAEFRYEWPQCVRRRIRWVRLCAKLFLRPIYVPSSE